MHTGLHWKLQYIKVKQEAPYNIADGLATPGIFYRRLLLDSICKYRSLLLFVLL